MTANPKRRKATPNRPREKRVDEQMIETFRHAASWGRRFNQSLMNPVESKWTRAQRETKEREWKLALEAELKGARVFLEKINSERKKNGKEKLTFYELEELIRKNK